MIKTSLILIVLSLTSLQLGFSQGSLCTGSLGENIFEEGDFGSGIANVLNEDPQLAPGYTYQTFPPPQDGLYTITNNTSTWGSFANTFWINIEDNSSDPNGYMMVINASDLPGVFFEKTIEDLCENTTYQFSADIINLFIPGQNGNLPNVDFLLDGTVQYSTGNIAEDATWNTYGFSFQTGPGETSKTLTLRNNAPGGFGNDLALDNISFRPCGPDIAITTTSPVICDGESAELISTIQEGIYDNPVYQWEESLDGGITWDILPNSNATNFPLPNPIDEARYRLIVANGSLNLDNPKCRVISNTFILEIQPIFFDIESILCEGLSLSVGNNVYTETGVYVDSLIASYGCDSIVTTDLSFVPNDLQASFEVSDPACFGAAQGSIQLGQVSGASGMYSYSLNGSPFVAQANFDSLEAGTYALDVLDAYGCTFSDTVQISNPAELIVDLPETVRLSLGDSYTIDAFLSDPLAIFSWTPEAGLSCTDCLKPAVTPTENMVYTLSAFLSEDCVVSDSIQIIVDKNRRIYFPNAFSPNDDGRNDTFRPYPGASVAAMVDFKIFDRWGELVFDADEAFPVDNLPAWDGNFKGKALPAGVYTYYTIFRFIDEVELEFLGEVSLIR